MKSLLGRRGFWTIFVALTVSMLAESVLILALGVWVKDLTGSDGLAGATFLALSAPMLVAPLAGWVVDRIPRRVIFVALNLITAGLLLPLLAVRQESDLWIVYTVAVGYGLSYIVLGATVSALVPELVPADLLPEANSALQTVKQALRLLGPLIGAGLFSLLGGAKLAAVCAVCFLVAGVVGMFLGAGQQVVRIPEASGRMTWSSEVSAGLRHLVRDPVLRKVAVCSALSMIGLGVGESLYFAYVDQGLGRDAAFLGVLVSAQGVGGVAGGVVSARIVRRFGEVGAVGIGIALFALGSLALVQPTLWLALPASVLIGMGLPVSMVGTNTLLQRRTPAHLLGRAATALDALVSGPQALAIGAGAVLVGVVDYRLLFAVTGVAMACVGGQLWIARRLAQPAVPATPARADLPG
ncbi:MULTISPECIES: MFS transporter [Streptomyces]|uniref:MFS transporter n=1 Tax=Streptomyces edwardsiae TaxID=3075527 RepID=A0ABU2PP51_9ACTN|nr:MFS transporter [Streptomyces sp. DSM 41636]MDT0393571.1 MFS transporter [Streptomyces sp. DSM 41636]